MRFVWNTTTESGPAMALFGAGGDMFVGYWPAGGANEHPVMTAFQVQKSSSAPGDCPKWKAPQDQMAAELTSSGRVRLYGINFDSDSDHIKDESKPTLDKIASMLKAKADWNVTIEGHTDSTSTPQHNQDLSERRAISVKTYVQSAGIAEMRLKTAGYGASKPVASNDTELGRAQNRRVELTKQ